MENNPLPSHMNGYLLEEFGKPYVYHTDMPVPKVERGMLLIRAKACGYCHTDMILALGVAPLPIPLVPGHEMVGVVAAVGEDATGFTVGDRVGTLLYRGSCGKCRECIRGTPESCSQTVSAGITAHGGIAQYFLADPKWTVRLPESMGFSKAAPLMCAGSTVYHSLLRCGVDSGGIIGVIGVGGLGHLAVQFAKAMGHKVVAIDVRAAPLELCLALPERLRADLVINSKETSTEEIIKKIEGTLTDDSVGLPATGFDAVLVCTDVQPAYALGIELLAKHGTLVFVGVPEAPVPMSYTAFIGKDITVVAGVVPCGRWSGIGVGGISAKSRINENHGKRWMTSAEVMDDMLDLVERAGIHVEILEYGMDDVGKMVNEFNAEGMKGRLVVKMED
ncbi:hypothetical protein M408DRAFT_265658 [Serendipita vermifera MAFF 305830]|uniref:Enoyl reductase (ER) domain-containing protein n=1 Tax=Serendipita vermifera MAFF 305830 TaxID=933852 RepID=A0A0C2W9U7_SERVB|nr:hypothetical protein M408DRAFT_265658 [Serendipita vermifera MAFF 305830]